MRTWTDLQFCGEEQRESCKEGVGKHTSLERQLRAILTISSLTRVGTRMHQRSGNAGGGPKYLKA